LLESVLLGLVQGITEFLPISSSGHLVLGQALLGVEKSGISFEVAVHLATGAAVVVHYRRLLWRMLFALRLVFSPRAWKADVAGGREDAVDREHLRLFWYLALGTLPAAVIGFAFKDFFEEVFYSPRLVCLLLLVTGAMLIATRLAARRAGRGLFWRAALLIGAAQAAAIFPGISRSGATIAAGLLLGLSAEKAAEFSFLLALPAIFGAALLELAAPAGSVLQAGLTLPALLLGSAAAFVFGYLAIALLLKVLFAGRFDRFAYYCWAVGLTGLVLL